MGNRAELLLGSCRAYPERALQWGYQFCYPGLLECLRHALGRYSSEDYPSGWSFEWGDFN
ncbi:DUF1731 domain-containing protein [bacterium]|nr:DUF1731 domain-containing protein [bacterium]